MLSPSIRFIQMKLGPLDDSTSWNSNNSPDEAPHKAILEPQRGKNLGESAPDTVQHLWDVPRSAPDAEMNARCSLDVDRL